MVTAAAVADGSLERTETGAGSLFGVQNLALLPNAIDPDHLPSPFGLVGLLIINKTATERRKNKNKAPPKKTSPHLLSKRARALQRCSYVLLRQQKECVSDVAITKPAL